MNLYMDALSNGSKMYYLFNNTYLFYCMYSHIKAYFLFSVLDFENTKLHYREITGRDRM